MERLDHTEFNELQHTIHKEIRYAFDSALEEVGKLPDCRPKSIAITKLEEGYMWAGKAVRDLTADEE